jgi:hypothetical protein
LVFGDRYLVMSLAGFREVADSWLVRGFLSGQAWLYFGFVCAASQECCRIGSFMRSFPLPDAFDAHRARSCIIITKGCHDLRERLIADQM